VSLLVRFLVNSARRVGLLMQRKAYWFVDAAQGVLFLLMQRKAYCFFVAGCCSWKGCAACICVRVYADVFWLLVRVKYFLGFFLGYNMVLSG
jgi:hypothetical protein